MEPAMDCGYGWMVTFACFIVCFIMQGLNRTAGVLYVAIIDSFGVSRESATTPFSLRYGVRNMMGPIVGILAHRFGMRAVVIAGGILASIGGSLCAIAPDVFWITCFWGIVHGVGYGLCTTIHLLILNQYFDKYKATSIAIAVTGDCFGTFVFPVLLEFLLFKYGVGGTFLILGGICLNVVPAGMIMRTPDWTRKLKEKSPKRQSKNRLSKHTIIFEQWGIENKSFEAKETCVYSLYPKEREIVDFQQFKDNVIISKLNVNQMEKVAQENNEINSPINIINNDNSEHLLTQKHSILLQEKNQPIVVPVSDLKYENNTNLSLEIQSITHEKTSSSPIHMSSSGCGMSSEEPSDTNDEDKACTKSLSKQISSTQSIMIVKKNDLTTMKKEQMKVNLRNLLENNIILDSLMIEKDVKHELDEIQSTLKRKDSLLIKSIVDPPETIFKNKNHDLNNEELAYEKINSMLVKNLDSSTIEFKRTLTGNAAPTQCKQKEQLSRNRTISNPYIQNVRLNEMLHKNKRTKSLIGENSLAYLGSQSFPPSKNIVNVAYNDTQLKESDKATVNIMKVIKQFLSLNIRPLFLLIGLNLASYALILLSVITILVDYTTDERISPDISKYLIISFSVADLFGRIGFGAVLDNKWIKLSHYAGGNMTLMGISVLSIPFFTNYWYIMSCMILFGLMQGGNAIIYTLLIEEYMNTGEELLALGCLNFYGGIIMFPMAPMIGFFRDSIGNYSGVFYTVGGLCLFAGTSWLLEPFLLSAHQRMCRKALQ